MAQPSLVTYLGFTCGVQHKRSWGESTFNNLKLVKMVPGKQDSICT